MNSKKIFLALILVASIMFIIGGVSATGNNTSNVNIPLNEDIILSDLEFEQSYDPYTIYKDDVFEVCLSVKNIGSVTFHNLTIYYPLPQGLDILLYPVEYQNNSVWVIDTLYLNETNYLTLVCSALVSNTTYEFTASVGNESVSTLDVYCQPDNIIPDDNGTDPSYYGLIKSVSEGNSLKDTANPVLLLLFAIIFIPYIRWKY